MDPKKLLQELARWCRGQAPYSDAVASVIGPTEDPWKLFEELRVALTEYVKRDLACEDPERNNRAKALVKLIVRANSVARNAGYPKSSDPVSSSSAFLEEEDEFEDGLFILPDFGDR